MSIGKQAEFLSEIHDALIRGEYDKAESLKIENKIADEKYHYELEQVFSELVTKGKITRAIELAEKYNFPQEDITKAAIQQYWSYYKNKEYDKAAQWGNEYNIPEQNVMRAAEKAFEGALKNHEIKKALQLKEDFNIQPESVKLISTEGFNSIYKEGEFINAALIGREFNISFRRTCLAAALGFIELCDKNDITKAVEIEREFQILSDDTFEVLDDAMKDKITNVYLKKVIENLLDKHKYQAVADIVNNTELLQKVFSVQKLNDFKGRIYDVVISAHNQSLLDRKYSEALQLKENFDLTGTELNDKRLKSVITTAQLAYSDLVKKGNLTTAASIKKDYGLFSENVIEGSDNVAEETGVILISGALEQGDMATVEETMKELNLREENVKETAVDVVLKLINKKDYDTAGKILKKFDLYNVRDIEHNAALAFDDAFHNGMYEQASTIGFIFKVNRELTKEAAFNLWKRYMLQHDFSKAKRIRAKFKLNKKMTEETANQVYDELIRNDKPAAASEIRKEYNLSKNIISILMEMFKKLFSK